MSAGTPLLQEYYEWHQRQLRQVGDINDNLIGNPNQDAFGTIDGELAMDIADFVGAIYRSRGGVLVREFDPNDTNNLELSDITVDGGGLDINGEPIVTTIRTFPFVAAGNLVFSQNLVDETNADTIFKMFFQYTVRETDTGFAVTAATGDTMTLTTTGTDLTTLYTNADYVSITGFTTNPTENNGLFQVSSVAAGSMDCRRVNGTNPVNESAGDTVNIDDNPFDSPDAIVVNDNGGSPITAQVTTLNEAFDYDYDGNVQGGRTAATDAPVAVIAQGLPGAQWVSALFTITRAVGLSFPVNASTERVFSNP